MSTLTCGLFLLCSAIALGDVEECPGKRYLELAAIKNVSPLQKLAYEKLAEFQRIRLFGPPSGPSAYQFAFGPWTGWKEDERNAFWAICKMGLDALPPLVDALDDETPTLTITNDHDMHYIPLDSRYDYTWKVNELAALAICHVTQRVFAVRHGERARAGEFIYDVGKHPALIPDLKKQVLDWYYKYRDKSLTERKIDDVDSDLGYNRHEAVQWIGEHKEKRGQQAVIAYVIRLFNDQRSSPESTDHDLAACALTLGQLGDRTALATVQRICKHLYERPGRDYANPTNLSVAREGLAILGGDEPAPSEDE
jgi:hypothetical protein